MKTQIDFQKQEIEKTKSNIETFKAGLAEGSKMLDFQAWIKYEEEMLKAQEYHLSRMLYGNNGEPSMPEDSDTELG